MPDSTRKPTVGQRDLPDYPRLARPVTFALLPRIDDVPVADVAVLGIPVDAGTSFRPDARFGPNHIREPTRQPHPYHHPLNVYPFDVLQIVDAGDRGVSPYDIDAAVASIEKSASEHARSGTRLVTLGGDQTVALPLLRAVVKKRGPAAVIHFDAHLDTWDTIFGADVWHGSAFRRAAEEGLLDPARCIIDVLDPAHAPATGTPEVAGLVEAGVDRITALTVTYPEEALGIIRATAVESRSQKANQGSPSRRSRSRDSKSPSCIRSCPSWATYSAGCQTTSLHSRKHATR